MDKIKIYGVLGYPVKHSLSPFMHNAAFRALNLDAEYKLFEKKPEELKKFFGFFNEENIWGVNVTIPYKETVLPFLNSLSEEAKLIGAVNTIKRVMPDKLEGYNTDGDGFIKHLRQDLLFEPKNKKVAILGAGGASKAISVYLSIARVKSIAIFDIDKLKAEILVNSLKEHFRKTDFRFSSSINGLNIKTSGLLVNATPIGMKDTDPCLVNKELFHKGMLVYDLIYNPKETKLLKLAKDRGAQVSNGLGMLLYQGARSLELWTQKIAPIEIMRQALNDAIS